MAHTDHLLSIVKLSSQQVLHTYSEISVCFSVFVHKYEQMTKIPRNLSETSNEIDRHKKQREKNNLQKTEIIQGKQKQREVLYHQCPQKDNRRDTVSTKHFTESCKGKLREQKVLLEIEKMISEIKYSA